MNLNDLLIYIDNHAKARGIRVFVVGGAVRDAFLVPDNCPHDIDLSTGDKSIYTLAYDLSKKFPGADFRIFDDRHTALRFDNFNVDFSSNFVSEGVKAYFRRKGIKATPLKEEMFSRDFTINTMMMNLKRDTVYDVTERGQTDITNKILRCPVSPEISLLDDLRRMLRAVKYSMKLGFMINDEEREVITKNARTVSDLPVPYVNKIVSEMLDMDIKKTIEELYELKLLKHVPLTRKLANILTKNRELAKYFRG